MVFSRARSKVQRVGCLAGLGGDFLLRALDLPMTCL